VDSKNTITKGVFTSALLVGITYVLASEAFTVGWGVNDMSSFFTNLVPGIVLGVRYGGPGGGGEEDLPQVRQGEGGWGGGVTPGTGS
jgi:hypothetical protein